MALERKGEHSDSLWNTGVFVPSPAGATTRSLTQSGPFVRGFSSLASAKRTVGYRILTIGSISTRSTASWVSLNCGKAFFATGVGVPRTPASFVFLG